jgi:DNA-binding response OmpR family regulator
MAPTTVLIIDDNVNLARGFAVGLANAGYVVEVAHSAHDGLALAASLQPQLIILDFQMPFVNGVGFLYRLREMPTLRETAVMVVTGVCVTDEVLEEFRVLHAELRFKPIGLAALICEVDQLVHREAPSLGRTGLVAAAAADWQSSQR